MPLEAERPGFESIRWPEAVPKTCVSVVYLRSSDDIDRSASLPFRTACQAVSLYAEWQRVPSGGPLFQAGVDPEDILVRKTKGLVPHLDVVT